MKTFELEGSQFGYLWYFRQSNIYNNTKALSTFFEWKGFYSEVIPRSSNFIFIRL